MEPATMMMVASAAMSGISMIQQGSAAKEAANFNARQADLDAERAVAEGKAQESEHRVKLRRFIATGRSAAGASGVVVDQGSAGLIAEDAAFEGELDALAIRYASSVEAARYRAEAASQRFQGRAAYRKGIMGAGASLLGGAADAAKDEKFMENLGF